jgi:hypothetical protein
MLLWLLKISFISIALILILHYLYSFFKMTLTVPKVKDLVYRPSAKYETLLNSINNATQNAQAQAQAQSHSQTQHSDFSAGTSTNTAIGGDMNANVGNSMENELKNYLKSLKLKKVSNRQSLSGELNLSSSNDMPNLMYSSY